MKPKTFTDKQEQLIFNKMKAAKPGAVIQTARKLGKLLGRSHNSITSVFYRMNPVKRNKTTVTQSAKRNVTAMAFDKVDFTPKRVKVTTKEIAAMAKGLDDSIANGFLSKPGGAILVNHSLVRHAQRYVAKTYSNMSFTVHKYAKSSQQKVLYRKY